MRPWYLLALSSRSSALTSLPKHALLSFVFTLTSFSPPLHITQKDLRSVSAVSPLPTLLRRGGASLCLILNRSFIVLPAAPDKGELSCPPAPAALWPQAASSRPEMQEEKQDVSFLFIVRRLGIGLESHLSGLRTRRQVEPLLGCSSSPPKRFWVSFDPPSSNTQAGVRINSQGIITGLKRIHTFNRT